MTVILAGLPGSGKTSVGMRFSEVHQIPFIDTDKLLESEFARLRKPLSCREIFQSFGEKQFRLLEQAAVAGIQREPRAVIATGGGTLLHMENVFHLRTLGKIIYLKGETPILFQRVIEKGMPAYLDGNNPLKSFQELANIRSPQLEKVADLIFEIGNLTVDQIVENLSFGSKCT